MLWWCTTLAGQWMFALYLALFYGASGVRGDFEAWTQVLPKAIIPGDTLGNVSLFLHLGMALFVIALGPLQLLPWLRQHFPAFHRWTGRIYVPFVMIAALGGLYMTWTRKAYGDLMQNLGISLDAVLILVFAVLALMYARRRNFVRHRQWALRLFLVVSAVWFFRLGLMAWLVINQGPVGFDPETFHGPFLTFLGFAQTLLPLVILELYLRAGRSQNPLFRNSTATVILLATAVQALGIFAASMGLWLPHM